MSALLFFVTFVFLATILTIAKSQGATRRTKPGSLYPLEEELVVMYDTNDEGASGAFLTSRLTKDIMDILRNVIGSDVFGMPKPHPIDFELEGPMIMDLDTLSSTIPIDSTRISTSDTIPSMATKSTSANFVEISNKIPQQELLKDQKQLDSTINKTSSLVEVKSLSASKTADSNEIPKTPQKQEWTTYEQHLERKGESKTDPSALPNHAYGNTAMAANTYNNIKKALLQQEFSGHQRDVEHSTRESTPHSSLPPEIKSTPRVKMSAKVDHDMLNTKDEQDVSEHARGVVITTQQTIPKSKVLHGLNYPLETSISPFNGISMPLFLEVLSGELTQTGVESETNKEAILRILKQLNFDTDISDVVESPKNYEVYVSWNNEVTVVVLILMGTCLITSLSLLLLLYHFLSKHSPSQFKQGSDVPML